MSYLKVRGLRGSNFNNHILPTNSNNQRVTLLEAPELVAGTHNTDHSAYNGLVRVRTEIHWDDGSVSSHKGHLIEPATSGLF